MKKYLLASLLLFFSHAGFAAPTGWYTGLGFGATSADVETSGVENELAFFVSSIFPGAVFGAPLLVGETWASSTDDSDNGWTAFVGYRVTPNLAIEGGYVDLGEFSALASLNVPGSGSATVAANAEATGIHAALLGLYPIGTGSVFGKIGLLRWDVDLTETITDFPLGGPVQRFSASDTGTDLLFGVGYQLMGTQSVGVRAEWTRYTDVGGEFGDTDVDWLGVSVLYSF